MRGKPIRWLLWIPLGIVLLAILLLEPVHRTIRHYASRAVVGAGVRDDRHGPADVLVTAYCNCGVCCSWRPRFWLFGDPVISRGPRAGRPKDVGRTASGRYASRGTVAADTKLFPFGTLLEIPGYGIGRVEDTGGAIKGRHVDVWFPTHEEALAWGARWLPVRKAGGKAAGADSRKQRR